MRHLYAGLIVLAAPLPLAAQCIPGGPANPPAVKRALVGLVLDRANRPIENATVVIRDPRRQGRTTADGRFQLDDLDTGTYQVTVRRLGYAIAVRDYIVPDSGGVARFCLVPEPRGLPPVISSVKGGGLTGVVGDAQLKPLEGAEVRALGAGEHATTDTAGGFFLDLKRGTYAVVASKDGYGEQLIGVTIPKDSGRQVALWLGAPMRNANTQSWAIEGLRQRVMLTPAHRYHQLSGEELARTDMSITQIVRKAAKSSIADDCEARIAGSNFSLPIYMLDKEDIMMLEVVGAPLTRGGPRGVTSINGSRPTPPRPGSSPSCGVSVIAWMMP